ncbi:MAG: hypothetical protein AUH12_03155 [Gemmatimonadetes bacterium 13_2_20CM_69_8]|nr:MAG: hypothetical protein AUH12_03155 [Gemmatimonadetes bacterium 13_2_20CM_69_8]OLD95405.1 MAG: hypothetical protein AUG79_05480 [Gemmatimonadetes bacterium 13_1_20CM_4_69_16]PYO13192.1 MAG: hypothetical protein DMD31_14340 [Gemmatimonadota bacterium]
MRLFRSHGSVALAALGGLAVGACGLADVFRPGGLKDVVLRYTGATTLNVGTRVAPAVTVEVDGVPMPNPRLRFSSSDTTILALTQIGDTLVACRTGRAVLRTRLISSMVADTAPTAQDSIRVTGGSPLPTCP